MWVLSDAGARSSHAYVAEQIDRACASRTFRKRAVAVLDRLFELRADGHHWVQVGRWVLEDDADVATAKLAELLRTQFAKILAFKKGFASQNTRRRLRKESERTHDHGCLSGAGLANNAECLARRNFERHVFNCGKKTSLSRERDCQVLEPKDRLVESTFYHDDPITT